MGTQRVRALLVTPGNDLLAIRRIRPGQAPYSVLPGGGVEPGEDLETALARELHEELAATAAIHSLLHILDRGDEQQYIYLTRVSTWSADASARSGLEFTDPARGEYHLHAVPLTAAAVAAINLKPDEFTEPSCATCAAAPTCSPFPICAPAPAAGPDGERGTRPVPTTCPAPT